MSTVEALEKIALEPGNDPLWRRIAADALPQARLEAKVIEAVAGLVASIVNERPEALEMLTSAYVALDALREGE